MQTGRLSIAVALLATTACATKGDVRNAVAEARTQIAAERQAELEAERQARMAADEQLRTEMQAQLAALRTELESLRSDFNTRITAMEDGIRFVVPVHFAFDDASVRPEDQEVLERFARVVQRHYPTSAITVEGFADPAGSAQYNLRLSQRRAESVREQLVQRGLDATQVRTVGYGENRLVVAGASRDEPGAEMNRRVVFVIESAQLPPGFVATTGDGQR